jgi:hypothetical protein
MDLQAKIAEILTATAMSSSKAEVVAAAILEALPDYAQQQARTEELEKALLTTRALVCEGANVGFNYADGDWAHRLYKNNGNIARALKETT